MLESLQRCQSCSIPLKKEKYCGTEINGQHSNKFCIMCYKDGQFTQPEMSLGDMAIKVTELITAKSKADIAVVRIAIELSLSKLDRWKKH